MRTRIILFAVGTADLLPAFLDDARLAVLAEYRPQRIAYLAHGRVSLYRLDERRHDVLVRCGNPAHFRQRLLYSIVVSLPLYLGKSLCQLLLHGFVDLKDPGLLFFRGNVFVDADDALFAGVHGLLIIIGGTGDLALNVSAADRFDGPAHLVNFLEILHRPVFYAVGEGLKEIRAGERVDGIGHAAFLGDDLLGPQGDPDRLLRGQGQRLVAGIGVQRLAAAHDRRHRLDGPPDDVVERLLFGQGGANRMGVGF